MKLVLSVPVLLACLVSSRSVTSGAETAHLGVRVKDVPEAIEAHLGLSGGAVVREVTAEGPAAKAGIQPHDVIVALIRGEEEHPVTTAAGLRDAVSKASPGDTVTLRLWRGKAQHSVKVTLGSIAAVPTEPVPGFLGVRYTRVGAALASHLGISEDQGVLVESVLDASPAEKAGLREFDVILSVNGEEIGGLEQLSRLVGKHAAGDTIELGVIQGGERRNLSVTLAAIPNLQSGVFGFEPELDEESGFERLYIKPQLRGKIILRDQDGNERVIEIPELKGELKDLGARLRRRVESHFERLPGDITSRLETLLRAAQDNLDKYDLDREVRIETRIDSDSGTRGEIRAEHHSAVVSRRVEDGYDITVRDENGRRTVTVKKKGETLAEELPIEEIDSLTEDVRDRVRQVSEGITTMQHGAEGNEEAEESLELPVEPPGPAPEPDEDEGIRV